MAERGRDVIKLLVRISSVIPAQNRHIRPALAANGRLMPTANDITFSIKCSFYFLLPALSSTSIKSKNKVIINIGEGAGRKGGGRAARPHYERPSPSARDC